MTTSGSGERRLRVIGAATLVLVPVLMLAVLIFMSGQVRQCLALYACDRLPPPEPVLPVFGTLEGLKSILVLLGSAWLVVAAAVTRYLWSIDRMRLRRAAAVTGGLGTATALLVAGLRGLEGARRRTIVEDAGTSTLVALILVVPVALAWAALSARTAGPRGD